MSNEGGIDSVHEQAVSTEYQDERVKRLRPRAIPPRAPVPSTATEKTQIRAATKAVAAKPFPIGASSTGSSPPRPLRSAPSS
jgi:hypothetical protein